MTGARSKLDPRFEKPRAPSAADRVELSDFLNRVFSPSSDSSRIEDWWGHVYGESNLPNIRIVRSGDRIVSSAATWITDTHIGNTAVCIGGVNLVGTDKEFRRLGLGATVLDACIEHLSNQGCHLSLLRSRLDDWYRKQGWESGGTKRVFHLNRGNRQLLQIDAGGEVREQIDADLDAIDQLRAGAKLGTARSAEITRSLFFDRKKTVTLVLERKRKVVAYVHGLPETIMEYCGPADDVLHLVRSYYERMDDPDARTSTPSAGDFRLSTHHLEIQTPGFEDPVAGALDDLGILAGSQYVGMWRILDLESLLECYPRRPIVGRADGGDFVLAFDGQEGRYSRTEAVKALFGPERPDEFARSFPPLPIWQWETDIV